MVQERFPTSEVVGSDVEGNKQSLRSLDSPESLRLEEEVVRYCFYKRETMREVTSDQSVYVHPAQLQLQRGKGLLSASYRPNTGQIRCP